MCSVFLANFPCKSSPPVHFYTFLHLIYPWIKLIAGGQQNLSSQTKEKKKLSFLHLRLNLMELCWRCTFGHWYFVAIFLRGDSATFRIEEKQQKILAVFLGFVRSRKINSGLLTVHRTQSWWWIIFKFSHYCLAWQKQNIQHHHIPSSDNISLKSLWAIFQFRWIELKVCS